MGVAPVGVVESAGLERPRPVRHEEAHARVERVQVPGHGDGVLFVEVHGDGADVQIVVRALACFPVELSAVGSARGLMIVAFRIRRHDPDLLVRFGEAMRDVPRERRTRPPKQFRKRRKTITNQFRAGDGFNALMTGNKRGCRIVPSLDSGGHLHTSITLCVPYALHMQPYAPIMHFFGSSKKPMKSRAERTSEKPYALYAPLFGVGAFSGLFL